MVTIKDVARRANVSVTSASYALNDTGTIAETTRNRILKAAKDLNYHPNAFARNLKKGKTHTIGVFISRFGGAFYEDILEGIHDTVLKTDYDLIVCPKAAPRRNSSNIVRWMVPPHLIHNLTVNCLSGLHLKVFRSWSWIAAWMWIIFYPC